MDRWNPDVSFVVGLVIVLIGSVAGLVLLVDGGRFVPGLATYLACLLVGGWLTVVAIRGEMQLAEPSR